MTAAPAIGDRAIWIGSEDFNVYAVDPGRECASAECRRERGRQIEGVACGAVADASKEWAFAASGVGSSQSRVPPQTSTTSQGLSGTVLRRHPSSTRRPRSAPRPKQRPHTASLQLRCDCDCHSPRMDCRRRGERFGSTRDRSRSATSGADLRTEAHEDDPVRCERSRATRPSRRFADAVRDSPIILASGDVIVGDQSGSLHRLTSTGAGVPRMAEAEPRRASATARWSLIWRRPPGSSSRPRRGRCTRSGRTAPIAVVKRTRARPHPSRRQHLHAVPADRARCSAPHTSAGANGKLHAVIVDGALDAAAPWPKAFHDPRNTNRAGAQP